MPARYARRSWAASPLCEVQPGVVEVRSEVLELGVGVAQQVPDDDQDGTADRDQRPLLASAAGDPSLALAEEGVGP